MHFFTFESLVAMGIGFMLALLVVSALLFFYDDWF